MKLIVSGASGFVGEEVVRQALADSRITSLIAISRSSITPPENEDKKADLAKFRNVIVKDYGSYPDEAKSEFEGVDAVIWYAPNLRPPFSCTLVFSGTFDSTIPHPFSLARK